MPKVSVVMPAYNRAQLIIESIQSVLDQTFTDFELVVVDDGSTDNTKEVIKSFEDPRVKYVYQDNQGASAARNAGVLLAQGEYVIFVDSDDVLVRNALERGVQVLDRHPEVAFSYGQAYLTDERGRIFGLRQPRDKDSYVWKGSKEIEKSIVNGNHIPTSTIMARRRCLIEVGLFDVSFRCGSEDFDLWLRMARLYSVAYIASPLVCYRFHNSNTCRARKMPEIEKSNSLLFERVFDDPELGSYFTSERPRAYFHMYLRLSDYAFRSREMETSRGYLLRAMKIQPKWFFKRLWLPLILRSGRTWLPPAILDSVHRAKLFLCRTTYMCILKSRLNRTMQYMSMFW